MDPLWDLPRPEMLAARRARMEDAAHRRAGDDGTPPGRALRIRDHLRRIELADFSKEWPEEDERLLDYLEDEGLYLDEEAACRGAAPSKHLAGFLASRLSRLFHEGKVAPTWAEVDLLAAWVERLLLFARPEQPSLAAPAR